MKLIPNMEIPHLYEQDGLGEEAIAYLKLFTPDSQWSWFITEYDPEEGLCFGLVQGLEEELGYFSLQELQAVRGSQGLPVERDQHFKPTPLKYLMKGGSQ